MEELISVGSSTGSPASYTDKHHEIFASKSFNHNITTIAEIHLAVCGYFQTLSL